MSVLGLVLGSWFFVEDVSILIEKQVMHEGLDHLEDLEHVARLLGKFVAFEHGPRLSDDHLAILGCRHKKRSRKFEQKIAKAAKVLRSEICDSRHCGVSGNKHWAGKSDMKFEKLVAELADMAKKLEMKGVTKSMLVRQLADKVAELAE